MQARRMDIDNERRTLQRFRDEMVEIRDVLEAINEDDLSNFDKEDVKRMEKEDERDRERKQKQQGGL